MDGTPMTPAERGQLIRLVKSRAKQAERDADAREKTLMAEVLDLMTAEFEAHDKLWGDAVVIGEEAAAKANQQIALACAELGIPPKEAPGLELGWRARGGGYGSSMRRHELKELARTRLAALTKEAKTRIHAAALAAEEQLVLGGLQSGEARTVFEALPSAENLMPALQLEDLGVTRWRPPADAAAELTTPLGTAARRARVVARAIEANPGASDRAIAKLAGVDHKTVATHRPNRGELLAAGGEFPTDPGDDEPF
jgi:hypothetical protein